MKTFEEVWAEKEREGYQYGEDALEQVRFGWDLAVQAMSAERLPCSCGASLEPDYTRGDHSNDCPARNNS